MSATIAAIIGAVGALGGGYMAMEGAKSAGGGDGFEQAPEFPESQAARGEWWNRLQQWGGDPNYGAIPQDWEGIWESAKNKLNRYYWGGPEEGGGVAGKVRASAARRGVSESPALETELSRMSMAQGLQQKDLNLQRVLSEAQFGERGRTNWLQSLQSLAGMSPGSQYIPGTDSSGMYGELGAGIGDIIGNIQNQNWMEQLMKDLQGGSGDDTNKPLSNYSNQLFGTDYFGMGKQPQRLQNPSLSRGGFNSSLLYQ